MVVSFSDTTEKKLLERACAGHDERFDRLAEAVLVMIWESDETGSCAYFNEQWISHTGRSLEDEVGDGRLVSDGEFAGYNGASSLIDRNVTGAITEYRNAERPPGEH